MLILVTMVILLAFCLSGCHSKNTDDTVTAHNDPSDRQGINGSETDWLGKNLPGPGQVVYTHINCQENGNIAVRIDLPEKPRYGNSAPIVVVAYTWFVEKYNSDEIGFHLVYNPVDIGAITVSHLWPGKTDPESGYASQGHYDFGGPDSIAALRDTIRFALGLIPDSNGDYLDELVGIKADYGNVGLFASSHAGVVATNVMAYFGNELAGLKYFVGRENPTIAEMYPLEIGHFDDNHDPVYNPFYYPENYTPTSVDVDYSTLGWIENDVFPEGRPVFKVNGSKDYVLDDKGPNIAGRRFFSYSLTRALYDNVALDPDCWPGDVATPEMVKDFWPYRITVNNYKEIGMVLPDLKILLPFAAYDHVQAAKDKPHIRHAYDGFHKTAGLWVRLNCDLSYVQSEISNSATSQGFPDNDANTEPYNWVDEAESWGFTGRLSGQLTARTVPLAGVAEMADRVEYGNWDDNLAQVLHDYR